MIQELFETENAFELPPPSSLEQRRTRFIDIIYVTLLSVFLVSINGIQKFPVLLIVNKLSGILLLVTSFAVVGKFHMAPLIRLLCLFTLVTFTVSVFTANDSLRVLDMTWTLVQVILLMVAVSQFYIYKGNSDYLLLAVVINSVVLAVAGHFINQDMAFQGNRIERYTSINNNPNVFAFQLLLGVVGSLYFWRYKNLVVRVLMVAVLALLCYYISVSGSRKAIVIYFVLILAWIYYSFPMKKALAYYAVLGLLGLIAGGYIFSLLVDTPVFQRFMKLEDNSSAADIRGTLYREAFEVFKNHPFFGVGLDNFRLYSSSGLYAHSNYMELLADNGILGFALFHIMYFHVWRLSQKMKLLYNNSEESMFYSGIFKCIIINYVMIAFGTVLYHTITHWVLIIYPVIIMEKSKLIYKESLAGDVDELAEPQVQLGIE